MAESAQHRIERRTMAVHRALVRLLKSPKTMRGNGERLGERFTSQLYAHGQHVNLETGAVKYYTPSRIARALAGRIRAQGLKVFAPLVLPMGGVMALNVVPKFKRGQKYASGVALRGVAQWGAWQIPETLERYDVLGARA